MSISFIWKVKDVDLDTQKIVEEKIQERIAHEPQEKDTKFTANIDKDQSKDNTAIVTVSNNNNQTILEGFIQVRHNMTSVLWARDPPHQILKS